MFAWDDGGHRPRRWRQRTERVDDDDGGGGAFDEDERRDIEDEGGCEDNREWAWGGVGGDDRL